MATTESPNTSTRLTPEQTFDLLIATQERLRAREAELELLQEKQDQAKKETMVAELAQGDSFTKRARPMVVYAGLVFIFLDYVLIPAICHIANKPLEGGFLKLPPDFWWAWTGIVATWSIGRSFEKAGVSNRVTRFITGERAPAPTIAPAAADGAVG